MVLARDNEFPLVAGPLQIKLARSGLVRLPLLSGSCDTFPSVSFPFLSSLFNLIVSVVNAAAYDFKCFSVI